MLELVRNTVGVLELGLAGHTYPGHVRGMASLIVCQVSRVVAAAGHYDSNRACCPPSLSSVLQCSHEFLFATGREMV